MTAEVVVVVWMVAELPRQPQTQPTAALSDGLPTAVAGTPALG
jgi:hypothetical protein